MQDFKKKFWLEKFDCFSVTGKDARKFLNGITTSNILNSGNKVIKTCWLTPNGVLRALIEIIFLEGKLEVIILMGNTHEIIDYFNQIIFPADDVLLSEPFLVNRIQEIDESNSWRTYLPIFFKIDDKEFEIYKNKLNLLNPNDLKLWKINQAIPSLEMEINGKNNPLELGLQDLIDFNKGCYLGQETMSKIKNVSSLKQEIRIWKSFESNLNLDVEDKNLYINSAKDISVGKITSFFRSDSQIKGLAMIKRKYLEEGSYFFSEIFGKIVINKSVGSIFL
ncbi:Folate-dependent protein for Fe/S cluster synthesis/repair in oxidative stress [Prochlorococcus marinus str. MIT 9321]|uniref:Folate-dependent protein for Fe/S cluster synthesis/repair in oxidative stress n=1 Tax=Prochlorococcus marinus str. MIT 9401 TaxID=167551 RepID=A0A0A2BAG2_PROMR|nr:folate-binding protein YgfZ [Prochlorococcus marinus]KGG03863.1 Folate-dependent protein for Fe/S cluster synthesis/repair in oxidative stress [Prochlorococcus marinus str. MIT 9321]KGG10122.1 Folate-dependent protein for Fe/S cluster synthesis/repair in oxidative stress [Prochlorococcus marinus str. MIT 9401]